MKEVSSKIHHNER